MNRRRTRRTARRRSVRPRARRVHPRLLGSALALALLGTALAVSVEPVNTAGMLASLRWPHLPELSFPALPLPDLAQPLRRPELRLRAIEFLGLRTVRARDLADRLALANAPALIDVDPDAVCEQLLEHPRVGECRALRLPPSRLIVAIEERAPLAVLERTHQGIDADGRRFELGTDELEGLPRVRGEPLRAVELARAARDLGVRIARISAEGEEGLVFEPAGRAVRVRVLGDPERALEAWLRLERSGLLEEHVAREVDLRFRGSAVLRNLLDNNGGE